VTGDPTPELVTSTYLPGTAFARSGSRAGTPDRPSSVRAEGDGLLGNRPRATPLRMAPSLPPGVMSSVEETSATRNSNADARLRACGRLLTRQVVDLDEPLPCTRGPPWAAGSERPSFPPSRSSDRAISVPFTSGSIWISSLLGRSGLIRGGAPGRRQAQIDAPAFSVQYHLEAAVTRTPPGVRPVGQAHRGLAGKRGD
jgi:hypothetical protein